MTKADLEIEITFHATRNVALHTIYQFDGLLLSNAGVLQLITDNVFAKKFCGRLRRKTVEVFDQPVQMTIEFGRLAFAVGVPEGVLHRVGWNVVTHHQRDSLLQQRRCFEGVLWVQRQGSRTHL
ncbi:hypothetical protein D3C71_1581890 [compost metagenome]